MLGIISTENKKFRPNDSISREESLKMLLKAAWIEVEETTKSSFADVSGWSVKYVEKAKQLWIVNWQTIAWKLIFRPKSNISRTEVAKVIVKTMEMSK